jgi:hypothetical protein
VPVGVSTYALSFGVSEIQFMWFPSWTTRAVVGLANW